MYILGISCYYHDSAACILKDGKIVAAAAEERFTRKKHDNSFPINAINFCLREARITPKQLDYVGFYEKPLLKFDRIIETAVKKYPKSFWMFYKALPEWLTKKLRLPSTLRKKLKYNGKIYFINHHLSHAASAFFLSPFHDSVIVTADGIGEWQSTGIYFGRDNHILPLRKINFPHSLGLFYSTITAFLGFKVNNDEYKVMGLAAYGKPSYYAKLKQKVIKVNQDGSFELNMKYFDFEWRQRMYSNLFIKEFGKPRRPNAKITKRDMDLAASLQKITEEIMLLIARYAKRLTNADYLCVAGGVGLNSKANGRLLREANYKDIFFMPVAGDDGGSIGVAKYIWHSILGNKKREELNHLYYGPEYSDKQIEDYFKERGVAYTKYKESELYKIVAKYLAENKIVGWFQGRMELGPRALGNRSILANPCNPRMKDIVNKKVKHREAFRPFAPAVLKEHAKEFFELGKDAPYMIYTTFVKKEKQKIIPAVTHVDGTARPQTVDKEINPRFYKLIREFSKLIGVPVLLNTSFNVRGEPIVCNIEDAYNCFKKTGIDVLVAGKCIVEK